VKKVIPVLGVVASVMSYSPLASALEPSAIYAKAKEFTVQIDGEETGTGTIIENKDGIYTVLTCWHVMDTPGSYQITTADGNTHQVTKIENLPDVDLAIITFSSSNIYPIAELGNSAIVTSGFGAYVVGYPDPFPGVPERSYFTDSAEIQSRLTKSEKGYQIIHSGSSTPGSSGGGIFDSQARLIGINGQFISEGNTGKAYGTGIPLEIYIAAQDNFAVPTNVTVPQDFLSVGKRKLKQEDYQGAIAEFDKALAANPKDISSLDWRAITYATIKDFNAAISDFDRIIDLDPNYALAHHRRGYVYFKLEDYKSAITNFDEAILLNPNQANYYRYRGLAYANLGDHKSAIADYDEAIRLEPNFAPGYFSRGLSYAVSRNYQSAIANYDEAIRLEPNYAPAYFSRSTIHKKLGDYENAITDYGEIIRFDPENAEAYSERGLAYYELEDYKRAIADFDIAIRLNPKFASAYYNRGNSYRELKNYESALADYDEAIRINPNYANAYYNRGSSYKSIGNNSDAIGDFKQAAELYNQQDNTEWYQNALTQVEQLQ